MSTEPRDNERGLETPAPSGSDARARTDTPVPDASPIAADSPESGDLPSAAPQGDAGVPQADNGAAAAFSAASDGNAAAGSEGRPRPADEPSDLDADADDSDTDIDVEDEEEDDSGPVEPIEEVASEVPPDEMEFRWYILKVQVNREDSIREALQRRISRAGLDAYFGEIVVPTEDVVEFNKNGKKRTVKRKLYPGYIIVNMALTEETWFLVRETPGIGDFTGSAGKPTPMDPDEVRRIIKPKGEEAEGVEEVRIAIPFNVGDRVRVKEGYFQNFEGDVESIDNANGRVTVMINIFGRSTPVELQHWQMERV